MDVIASPLRELKKIKDDHGQGPAFVNWGVIDYEDALREQLAILSDVIEGKSPDTFIFCSHNPVVTLGRGTKPGDVFGWTGQTVEIQRGGRATYHGPNQLVVYGITNLQKPIGVNEKKLIGIREYIRFLENSVVTVLRDFNIHAVGKTSQKISEECLEGTGVWVGEKKIASIGIGVKRWITYHGLALNLDFDPSAFQGINPCGFNSDTMISVEEILGERIPRSIFRNKLMTELSQFPKLFF